MLKTKLSSKENVTCFIQARLGSTRLPKKILYKLSDISILEMVIKRIKKSKYIDQIVILTTTKIEDDPIVELCLDKQYDFFRGSENDVLNRFYKASLIYPSNYIVRLNSDCPFIDWDLIDECISIASLDHKYDYVSTILSNSFPIGQHVEVFKSDLISLLNSKALDPIHREHVTPYIYQNRNLFNIYSLSSDIDLSCYRLTIDYEQDYLMFKELIGKLNEQLPPFKSIINVLKKFPDISSINSHLKKSQYIKK